MDCQMPLKDGFDTTRDIRAGAVPGKERIPIIALTAYAMPEDRERCLAAGMDDYLAKPLRLEQLRRCIEVRLFANPAATPSPSPTPALTPSPNPSPVPLPETVTAGALDPAQLEQLRQIPGRSHASLLVELAELLLNTAPGQLELLREAVARADQAQAQHLAHRLAGSCAHLGALRMRQRALELEKCTQQSPPAEWPAALAHVEAEWVPVSRALKELLP